VISIVIPTRNRPVLLTRLVSSLESAIDIDYEIVIIDSSDGNKSSENLAKINNVRYYRTEIKSAAIQRNIGIDKIENTDFVFFLDDDVLPNYNFFKETLKTFNNENVVGVSGLAISTKEIKERRPPSGLIGLIMIMFLLDSKKDGILLKSGVNIPVRDRESGISRVDWLIGCSAWRFNAIGQTRFESDFLGQSLAEDVIFSVRMNKKGKLLTNSEILLAHDESDIERPKRKDFWEMWVKNRYRLVSVANPGPIGKFSFWWANLGQLLILSYSKVRKRSYSDGSISGLVYGGLHVLRNKN
jgi:glycosyltransferase involved in cell wall biosynthesis